MPTRSESPGTTSENEDNSDRLAQLEALLSKRLYSSTTSTSTSIPQPPSPPLEQQQEEQDVVAVNFRLFSSQKLPTKVTIRESSPIPLKHLKDPRIRSVDDEDPQLVLLREQRIEQVVITGQEIIKQSTQLPIPHSPSFRHTTRKINSLPQAPSDSTRENLPLPRLAYLNSILPSTFSKLSPLEVPLPSDKLSDAPREPNEGLISKGPYTLGKNGTGIQKRLPSILLRGLKEREIKFNILPILQEEKDNEFVTKETERKRVLKEKGKELKKKLKLKSLALKHEDHLKQDNTISTKKKKQGRLSKERRERARKRQSKKEKEV
ncbi:hypothetical protein JCM5350_001699 [Sporobolomyces pararoseus]